MRAATFATKAATTPMPILSSARRPAQDGGSDAAQPDHQERGAHAGHGDRQSAQRSTGDADELFVGEGDGAETEHADGHHPQHRRPGRSVRQQRLDHPGHAPTAEHRTERGKLGIAARARVPDTAP
ncbi:MAG: hypothetical protein R2715_06315 [Ilumatobacteraceae bacterium]